MIYGGLIVIVMYSDNVANEDFFLLLEGPPFGLLDGQNMILL